MQTDIAACIGPFFVAAKMNRMGYVSKDQIERARHIHVLDYVLAYERGSIKRVGSSCRHKGHPSLAINESGVDGFFRAGEQSAMIGITA